MDKQKILKDLDELDTYIYYNLGDNRRFKNINDIQARINLDYIKRMETILQSDEVPGVIKSRYLITKSAYEVAGNKETQENSQTAQLYFDYIESKRNIARYGVKSVQQALSDIAKAVQTDHFPDQRALNLIYSGTPVEKRYYELILKPIVDQIKEATKYKETALTVQNERTSLFAKIRAKLLSIFKPRNKNLSIENDLQNNYSANAPSWREQQKVDVKSNVKNTNIQQEETEYIAISDLHGNMTRWNQAKQLLNKNPNLQLIILGDAMDRDPDGLNILLEIKKLSEQGKIQYLPGNHDIFAYEYLSGNAKLIDRAKEEFNLNKEYERNGEYATPNQLDRLPAEQKETLKQWLGKLPIQIKMQAGNNNYAIAHAIFDEELYNKNPNYSLKDALPHILKEIETDGLYENEDYDRFRTIMWYRENDTKHTQYINQLAIPEYEKIIVGHTPQLNGANKRPLINYPKNEVRYIDTSTIGRFHGWNLNNDEIYVFSRINEQIR